MNTTKSVADELRELASDLKAFYSLPGIAEHIMEMAACLDRETEERNSGREWWVVDDPYAVSAAAFDTDKGASRYSSAQFQPCPIIRVREVKP